MAASKQKAKKERKPKVRVNIRIPSYLVDWAKDYAKARNTTFTQVVVDRLTDLQAEESA
jgi:hypothetical protein